MKFAPNSAQTFLRVRATSRDSSSLSITHGPAMNVSVFGFVIACQSESFLFGTVRLYQQPCFL